MNSLEFIDEEIKQLEKRKENAFKNEYYSIYKECSQKITVLQQIKAELEAWEVVKSRLKIHNDGVIELQSDFWLSIFTKYTSEGYKDQYYKLKKALEVKK